MTKELIARFWENVSIATGHGPHGDCWVWIPSPSTRYGQMGFEIDGTKLAHRASWIIANKKHIPDGMKICHTCDFKRCVRPSHLFVGTTQDNSTDMVIKGRSLTGDRNHKAKLTWNTAAEIAAAYLKNGVSMPSLAERYGVTYGAVSFLLAGKTWKGVLNKEQLEYVRVIAANEGRARSGRRGEDNGRAKLNASQVRYIREHKEAYNSDLANVFGVSAALIRMVKRGRVWRGLL